MLADAINTDVNSPYNMGYCIDRRCSLAADETERRAAGIAVEGSIGRGRLRGHNIDRPPRLRHRPGSRPWPLHPGGTRPTSPPWWWLSAIA
jgi:hypothetical protein